MKAGWALLLALSGPVVAAPACDDRGARGHPTSAAAGRFHDNGDGTVTDTASALMWMRCSAGQAWQRGACSGSVKAVGWDVAQADVADVNRRGSAFFNDWRLPSLRELATIAERQCASPRIDLSVFPDTAPAAYWTTSSRPDKAGEPFAFALSFDLAGVIYSDKQEAHAIRLVRSAP